MLTCRRSQYHRQHKATICLANAVSVALRAHLAQPPRPDSGLTTESTSFRTIESTSCVQGLFSYHPAVAYADIIRPPPAHGHIPHPLYLVYIWLVELHY